jgi:uncharacterized protein
MGQDPSLCIFAKKCGKALIIEHNGDLYSCDHFVYPEYNLGNVREQTIRTMVASPEQNQFGADKEETLPLYCRQCDYQFACNGGCPKQRFTKTPEGEDGLNYLCKGYKMIFGHMDPYMHFMANELRLGRPAAHVMAWAHQRDQAKTAAQQKLPGRNDPCGSGHKYKRCCGKAA